MQDFIIPNHTIIVEPPINDDPFYKRFSSLYYTKKIPKGFMLCDYDKSENLIELESSDGIKFWTSLENIFGKFIFQKDIWIKIDDDYNTILSIEGVEYVKIKRSNYLKLIFYDDLPF